MRRGGLEPGGLTENTQLADSTKGQKRQKGENGRRLVQSCTEPRKHSPRKSSGQRPCARPPLPAWSNDDAVTKVLSGQRASKEDLLRYFDRGMEFARNLIGTLEVQLRGVLCEGTVVRKEILGLQDNTKEVIRYVASLVVGVLLTTLPGAVALAVTSIATTLAVILIKRNLTQFCAVGAQVVG